MLRVKNFDSTGIAPNGVLYSGDLNAIQDAAAALSDFTQVIELAAIAIGEIGLQVVRYGSGEARLTGSLRTDKILRGLGGIISGAFTTTARNAIPTGVGQQPYGMIILNTTTNKYEWNTGNDSVPAWKALGLDGSGVLSADGYVDSVGGYRIGGVALAATNLSDSALLARLASPTFTGTPAAPTAAPGDSTTKIATTAFTAAAIAAAAPGAGSITTAMLQDGAVNSAKILDGSIVDADISGSAAIAPSKISGTAVITSDSRLSDQRTPLANSVDSSKIIDGAIVDADINAGAAIALTKLLHLLLRGPDDSTQLRVAYGHTSGVTVGPNPATYGPVSFGITFASAPMLFFNPTGFISSASSDIAVTTTNFTLHNQGNGTDGRDFNWIAIGPA